MYQQQTVVKCTSGLYNEQVTYFVQKANEFRVTFGWNWATRR